MKLAIQLAVFLMVGFNSRSQVVADRLKIPGPINYENIDYNLIWSSKPAENYFSQEYLPVGADKSHFKRMILVEAVLGDLDLLTAVQIKVEELKKRQARDPVLNFKVYNNPDKTKYLVDFIVSKGKERLSMVEWDAYVYQLFSDKNGRKGVQIFAVVFRETEKVEEFLRSLSQLRKKEINELDSYTIPKVEIAESAN